ncbi:MAG: extracellular matrix/biofilm biosynthesis regulator RemA family protein [Dehalococcoidia bacterium]
MNTELIHVGFGNILAMNKVVAIVSPGSAPIKRLVEQVGGRGMLIDLTNGKKTKAIIIMDSGHMALTAISSKTIANRVEASRDGSFLGQTKGRRERDSEAD